MDGVRTKDVELVDRAVQLARELQARAVEMQTAHERRQQAELDRMLQTPGDKATLVQITDQAFRPATPSRSVDHAIFQPGRARDAERFPDVWVVSSRCGRSARA
jgi:hypothetical protein